MCPAFCRIVLLMHFAKFGVLCELQNAEQLRNNMHFADNITHFVKRNTYIKISICCEFRFAAGEGSGNKKCAVKEIGFIADFNV